MVLRKEKKENFSEKKIPSVYKICAVMLIYKWHKDWVFMSNTRKNQENNNPSMYTRSINLLEDDPLEEIFALNLGDFLTEHLINPEFVDKISTKAKIKKKTLKHS